MFRQILDNAIKFTNEGGVTITCSKEKIGSDHFAKLSVSDTGIGIKEDSIKIIFEPFRQESEGISRNYEGAGLGLAIVKRIVELLKGKIYVDVGTGKGTTFTVLLPTSL
jgi:signal transduction histidine kinase